jgi:Uma2 family endonuclease
MEGLRMGLYAPPRTPRLPPPEPLWPFTVEDYHRMIASGILTDEDRVELLEGWIVPKTPRNPRHDATLTSLHNQVLGLRVPGWFHCRGQAAVTTADSKPEPALAVVRGSPWDYADRHPGPGDLALAVEVSDTTLRRDRSLKQRLYARARVPVYWIVNLVDRQVEVYTDPTGPADEPTYRQRQDFLAGGQVPLTLGGQVVAVIPVAELLPPEPAGGT